MHINIYFCVCFRESNLFSPVERKKLYTYMFYCSRNVSNIILFWLFHWLLFDEKDIYSFLAKKQQFYLCRNKGRQKESLKHQALTLHLVYTWGFLLRSMVFSCNSAWRIRLGKQAEITECFSWRNCPLVLFINLKKTDTHFSWWP